MIAPSFGCAAVACALCGCAQPAAAPGLPALPPYVPRSVTASAEQTLADLGRLRHLPTDAPVTIDTMDDDGFLRAFHAWEASQKLTHKGVSYFSAFGLADASTDVAAMAQRLADDTLEGFYDTHDRRLYVRKRAKPVLSDLSRLTLAHEEEHALQDRFFGIPNMAALGGVDESLAVHALFEGDATVASIALDVTRHGGTAAEAMARMARLNDDDSLLRRASAMGHSEKVPPLLGAQFAWPYVGGAAFVAQLAASGGWTLVNAAMHNPPKTTEQVLHVEKYVAGEAAIDVRPPAPPDGYARLEIGRMGELQTRFFLAECAPDADAKDAARGWGGDAFLVAARGSERAVLWSTAWDDDGAAGRFAAALEARRTCAGAGAKLAFTVVRDGTRVAFVQGLDDEATRTREAAKLLTLVGRAAPPLPPIGQVTLVHPPISNDFVGRAIERDGHFVDPPLGLSTDMAGLRRTRTNLLDLQAVGRGVTVVVTAAWAPPSVALTEATVGAFVNGVHGKTPDEPMFDLGTSKAPLAWTTGEARTIRVGNRLYARFVMAPACDGKMTIILICTWMPGTAGEATANAWLKSVRLDEPAPACAAMRTLKDPGEAAN
jgi:hypothetical protein